MLSRMSAPAPACWAAGPSGTQMSSQIDTPATTPLISHSAAGAAPGKK